MCIAAVVIRAAEDNDRPTGGENGIRQRVLAKILETVGQAVSQERKVGIGNVFKLDPVAVAGSSGIIGLGIRYHDLAYNERIGRGECFLQRVITGCAVFISGRRIQRLRPFAVIAERHGDVGLRPAARGLIGDAAGWREQIDRLIPGEGEIRVKLAAGLVLAGGKDEQVFTRLYRDVGESPARLTGLV